MSRWIPVEATGETEVTLNGETFVVGYIAKGRAYYDPGRLSGPPEKCYPPEGEAEMYSCIYDMRDADGNVPPKHLWGQIQDKAREAILDDLMEAYHQERE